MSAYYNEFDPYAAQWLRNLIAAGHIAPGDIDERSIVDVSADDLKGYTQCHFFAGIGGWSLAARLAGWSDDRELWTGSCPCQPFSVAGKQAGQEDERHLWPVFAELIRARRPSVVMGEQVAAAVGKHWLDGVCADLEGFGYSVGAAVVPACAVDAPHRRDRLWFVADSSGQRGEWRQSAPQSARGPGAKASGSELRDVANSNGIGSQQRDAATTASRYGCAASADDSQGVVAHTNRISCGQERQDGARRLDGSAAREVAGLDIADNGDVANSNQPCESKGREQRSWQLSGPSSNSRGGAWSGAEWLTGADGKARRFEPGIRLLAHGVPARVGKLRAYGNAIVPALAAEIIGAFMDARP